MSTLTSKGIPVPENATDDFDPEGDIGAVAAWLNDNPGIGAKTTAQRDVLTGADVWAGRVIFNSTTQRLEVNKTGAAGGGNWGPLPISAADLTGTLSEARLPDQLRAVADVVTDWDTATASGFYQSLPSATHAPTDPNADTWAGLVVAADGNLIVQTVSPLTDDPTPDYAAIKSTYRRVKQAGAWTSWTRVDQISGSDITSGTVSINRLPVAASGSSSSTQLVRADDNRLMPAGTISMYAASGAPAGWLPCGGQPVSRATYAALFAAIGTTYGAGDGSTTFNVPSLKGRVPVGLDATQDEFDALGETGGEKTHTLTTAEMPAHKHVQAFGVGGASSGVSGPTARASAYQNAGTGVTTGSGDDSMSTTGSGGAHNNLQPYLVVNFIIKA